MTTAATKPPTLSMEELTERERLDYESDMDSLHVLPLRVIPSKLPGLKRARLIKNVSLNTVIEVFKNESTGSGQVKVNEASKLMGIPDDEKHPDIIMLEKIAALNSFDVYTLRIELRKLGVAVNEHNKLKLSKSKNEELTEYMREFTRPLLSQVYTESCNEIENISQIIDLFTHPNQVQAIENLKKLASTLNIDLNEIPKFLEDYGDIFMSLAYFKNHLDIITPNIADFNESMKEIRCNFQFKNDKNLLDTSLFVEGILNKVSISINKRFENFEYHSNKMWSNINAESFRHVKKLISSHHSTIGGVLCGLAMKMSIWDEKFSNGRGGPQARADFVLSDLRNGIDKILKIETSAPQILNA